VVFEADWNPAISANPYQSFFYKAVDSGEFTFTWKDDDGSDYVAKNKLTVA
jgi:sulfur-oxidizing protein SoxZ